MSSIPDVAGAPARARSGRAVSARSRRAGGVLGGRINGSPWIKRNLAFLLLWQGVGLIGIAITWIGSSGEVNFRDQTLWTAYAVLAVVIAAAGGAHFLMTGLVAVARERREVRDLVALSYARTPSQAAGGSSVVTAAGMRRYHLASCDVVRGKHTRAVQPGADDLAPCGMCQP